MDKVNVTYNHNGIQVHEKEILACSNTDGPGRHNELNKPNKKVKSFVISLISKVPNS